MRRGNASGGADHCRSKAASAPRVASDRIARLKTLPPHQLPPSLLSLDRARTAWIMSSRDGTLSAPAASKWSNK
eukprot:1904334-Prymnesium_polylepis.1